MNRILGRPFYTQPTLEIAPTLLGKYLIRRFVSGRKISRKITEVEAYAGFRDRASHASRGKTKRNAVMFDPAGCWYVYFTYGMHWMLNIVTEREGYPAAILIRGVDGISGPARVTKFFKIDSRFNGKPALPKTRLWIEDRGLRVPARIIRRSRRIGVDYAGPWKHKLWNFRIIGP